MKRILCIGTCSNPMRNIFTGQSVMFDGVVDYMRHNEYEVSVLDISQKIRINNTFFRSCDFVLILFELFVKLLGNHYEVCYITTAQSKKGFYRDAFIITLCRLFRIPVVAHQYGANYHQLLDSLNNKGLSKLKNILGYVSKIIVEGDYMKEQYSFLHDYKNKVVVIPNGLPIEGKHSQISKEYKSEKPFTLFYLSNLIWSKGYFDVLQAVDILVNVEHLDVKCVFAGRFMDSADDARPGVSNKYDFDAFVNEHLLADKVEYYQGLYGDSKDEHFYRSNVFILPTYYINEGQPVSILEAMSYGCVPLVTRYRHIPMMVNETNGFFVEPHNPEDIANHIKYLMAHPDEYTAKSKQCIVDYQKMFKFDVHASKLIKCVNSVIS